MLLGQGYLTLRGAVTNEFETGGMMISKGQAEISENATDAGLGVVQKTDTVTYPCSGPDHL